MTHRLLALLVLPALGCSDSDAAKLRRVGDRTYDRVTQAAQQVADELGQTLLDRKAPDSAPPPPELVFKVQQRLAWDRDLDGLSLQVTVEGDVVTLQGQVKTEAQQQRALELAEKTVGVAKVTANLEIIEATPKESKPPSP